MTARLRIVVTLRAAAEIDAADAWWSANRLAAPDAIRDELTRALELISTHPRVGAMARGTHLAGVRRVHLSRVSYHMYYRVTADTVEVLAFWHTSRGIGPAL